MKRDDLMYNAAVIDNDNGCLEYMSRLLEQNGHITSVTCFQQWASYLEELKNRNIHIAFIRVDSPGLQGFSLAKVTQKVSPVTRIVFISSAESYAVIAFEERASGYLVLPVRQKRLDEVIENIRKRDLWRRGGLSK